MYKKMLVGTGRDLYGSKLIELPFPKFVVFYNGTKELRRLEEYSLFIGKVRENLKEKTSIREAIDRAVDECIKKGIF